MEGITHKIRYVANDKEIEVVGTKQFVEDYFEKLNTLKTTRRTRTSTGKRGGKKPSKETVEFMDNIIKAAYTIEKKGVEDLLISHIRGAMEEAGVPVPAEARDLSIGIRNTIKNGYLERSGVKVGTQKAVRLSEKGKKRVEKLI